MARSKEIWRLGSVYVETFMDPDSTLLYLRNEKKPDTILILSIGDLAEIIAAHQRRDRTPAE